jgi:hypothetical protein
MVTYWDGKPVPGKWHSYPDMAAAGLWKTPTDLANFAIEIALSKNGKSNRILSQGMTKEMHAGSGRGWAWLLPGQGRIPDSLATRALARAFKRLLTMNSETGKGVVIMADSDNGISISELVLRSVAKEYGWNYKSGDNVSSQLYLLALVNGSQAALQRYGELKKENSPDRKVDEGTLNGLGNGTSFSFGHETLRATVNFLCANNAHTGPRSTHPARFR